MDAFVKSLTSKTSLLNYDVKGDKIIFPKDKNPSIETTKKIVKTVMNNAKVDFKFEGDKPTKKATKESKEKELRLLIREEIKNIINENVPSFDDLEYAIKQHEKDNYYYNTVRLINIFNQLESNDQQKARKKYSKYF
jgi:cystathionine beta-lyase/cystathionine gamma-synthase